MGFLSKIGLCVVALLALAPTSASALSCGEFTPMIGNIQSNGHYEDESPFQHVHFFPKHCNKIIISGVEQTIPAGVGVISGGVSADVTNTCIDKVCGQALAPNTLYRVYVYMDSATMRMSFSTSGHREDSNYGNEVHVSDASQSLVGMVYTDETGSIRGDATHQNTISWFNRGHTGLAAFIGWGGGAAVGNSPNKICPTDAAMVSTGYTLEFMTFGINDTFRQAFTVPNVQFSGMVGNENLGGVTGVGISFNGSVFSNQPWAQQATQGAGYFIHDVAIGAGGADEGHVKATLMVGNLGYGGCVHIYRGTFYLSPLHS